MNELSKHIGARIRSYRRERKLTLQQLADLIHKSRASVSKYETGEITLDVETLYDISAALGVEPCRLMDYRPPVPMPAPTVPMMQNRHSPFYEATLLYFYYFDGRFQRLKDGVIRIRKSDDPSGTSEAFLTITSVSSTGRSSEVRYSGKVVYSDMLIRFSFVNQYNSLEEDLLYIFNPLELRDFTEGLLCGISSADLMPCAFKCLVTLTPQEPDENLKQHLLFNANEMRQWQKLNMLLVDNCAPSV